MLFLTEICKLTIKAIRHGIEDEAIIKEFSYLGEHKRKGKRFDLFLSLFLCAIFCVAFIFSLSANSNGASKYDNFPTMRVVRSASMSKKHEKNIYLKQNGLNDQIKTFDLVFTYKVPKEEDIKLYDIVVYKADGKLIIHRIVGIEEPNQSHPNERWFLCQGDANSASDRFPVKYGQLMGIYRGERVPFVGSFILFMQSPAGWLCLLLVVAMVVVAPIIEKRLKKERYERYLIVCDNKKSSTEEVLEKEGD